MLTKLEKWTVIREMVKEKYYELRKAISSISINNDLMRNRLIQVNKFVRGRFLPKDVESALESKWLDSISAVDLLHVYSFLNVVLRCFYYHVPVYIEPINRTKDILIDYNMSRTGDFELSNRELYNKFINNLKTLHTNKYFCKNKKNATILYEEKPKSKPAPIIDFYNQEYRGQVVSQLIVEAVDRYTSVNKHEIPDDFEEAKQHFKLYSSREFGLQTIPSPDFDSEIEDEIHLSFVGIDEWGHPITKDKNGNLYNHENEPIDDETYYQTDI